MKRTYDINDAFAFLSGEMSSSEAEAYEASVRHNPAVAEQLDEARAARALFAQSAEQAQPSELDWPRIDRAMFDRIAQEDAPPVPADSLGWLWRMGRGMVWMGAAAALALGLYVSYRALSPTPSLDAPETTAPVAVNAPVEAELGELVAAGKRSKRVTVAMATVTLTPATACKVAQKDGAATIIDLIGGSATFDVGKRAPGEVFQVRANDVLVTVVGTRFTVSLDAEGSVSVAVDHGIVRVKKAAEAATTLRGGDSITMAPRDVAAVQEPVVEEPVVEEPVVEEPVVEEPVVEEPVIEVVEEPVVAPKTAPKKRTAAKPKTQRKRGPRIVEIDVKDPHVKTTIVTTQGIADPVLRRIWAKIGKVSPKRSRDDLKTWLRAAPQSSRYRAMVQRKVNSLMYDIDLEDE